MGNIIVIAILIIIVCSIIFYLWKMKKRGIKCIGCPYSNQCKKKVNKKSSNCNK